MRVLTKLPIPPTLALRAAGLAALWRARGAWRAPLARALLRREREHLLARLLPVALVVGLGVGLLLFVTLRLALQDAFAAALRALWPAWVLQGIPLVAALLPVLLRAPSLSIELVQRQQRGEFAALALCRSGAPAYPGVPVLAAHAMAAAAAALLLGAASTLAALAAVLWAGTADLRSTLDAVFGLVSPLGWLHSSARAALQALCGSTVVLLVAWPGTQTATDGVAAHRLATRATRGGAAGVIAAALLLQALLALPTALQR